MAKTYAGYVKRDEGSFIDWGKIGKDFSDQLFEIRKGIVENKRQIQKDDDQFLDQLANNPMTGVTTIDDFTTDMVGKIQNQLLMLNEARERGELGDQAYVQIRQRVTSGYNNVSTLAKNAGVKMNAIREKIARGEAVSKAEIALQEQIENMSNFGKTRYYVDPYDGRSYLAKIEVDENGVPTTRIDKDNLYSVQALNQISQRNVALVDASKIADSIYNKFSKTKIFRQYADENGVKKAVEYFFQKDKDGNFANPEAIESLGLTIEQALAQSDVVTSVLVDNQGDYNVNGKLVKSDDPNMINIVSEGGAIQFDVTDKQREAAKDYVMDLVMGRFSDVVKEDALTKYQEETLKLQRQRLALQREQADREAGATDEEMIGRARQMGNLRDYITDKDVAKTSELSAAFGMKFLGFDDEGRGLFARNQGTAAKPKYNEDEKGNIIPDATIGSGEDIRSFIVNNLDFFVGEKEGAKLDAFKIGIIASLRNFGTKSLQQGGEEMETEFSAPQFKEERSLKSIAQTRGRNLGDKDPKQVEVTLKKYVDANKTLDISPEEVSIKTGAILEGGKGELIITIGDVTETIPNYFFTNQYGVFGTGNTERENTKKIEEAMDSIMKKIARAEGLMR